MASDEERLGLDGKGREGGDGKPATSSMAPGVEDVDAV
jgi:hypothetical protein